MLVNARLNMSHLPPLSIGMNQRVFAVPTLTLFNMRVRWCSFLVSYQSPSLTPTLSSGLRTPIPPTLPL
jgi:hypothetical protein